MTMSRGIFFRVVRTSLFVVFISAACLVVSTACAPPDITIPRVGGQTGEAATPLDSSGAWEVRLTVPDGSFLEFDTILVKATVLDYRGNEISTGGLTWSTQSGVVSSEGRQIRIELHAGLNRVVATYPTPSTYREAIAVVNAVRRAEHGFIWTANAGLEEIPLPPGALAMVPRGVNNSGQVVGEVIYGSSRWRAFVWSKRDGLVDIGLLAQTSSSRASGISEDGIITGWSGDSLFLWTRESGMTVAASTAPSDFHPTALNSRGVVSGFIGDLPAKWTSEKGTQSLQLPSGSVCGYAMQVAESGEIFGFAGATLDRAWGYCWDERPVIWGIDGQVRTIGFCESPTGCQYTVAAMNDMGGLGGVYPDGLFKWTRDGGLKTLAETRAGVSDLNNNGDLVGAVATPGTSPAGVEPLYAPLIWSADGTVRKLTLPPERISGAATSVSETGIVVGWMR